MAARAGDRRAAESLIAAHLPLLYGIVGRALGGHADVDDVVQETILRVHRDLPALRTPASFRSWLVSIALHQISSRLRSWQQDRSRSVPLDDAAQISDPGAEFADVTLLRLGLSGQRRQVAAAARWLDPDDRELARLWWRELAGDLDRADVVRALAVDPAHARVRIQRMRRQLELSRFLVAALSAEPRCPQLDALAEGWDGTPTPRWRKRFARHLRDCPVCGATRSGFVPLERLLAGAALVPLPAAGVAAGGLAAGTGVAEWLGQLVGAKIVAAVLAGAAVSGGVYLALPEEPPDPPRVVASAPAPPAARTPAARPSPRTSRPARPRPAVSTAATSSRPTASPSPAGLVPFGPAVIRPAGRPDSVLTVTGDDVVVADGVPGTVVTVVPGIADPRCLSLRAPDGRYLRHASFRIVLGADDGRPLFRMDATFCPRPGAGAGTVRLASVNYPDRLVRVSGPKVLLEPPEPGDAYVADTTFTIAGP